MKALAGLLIALSAAVAVAAVSLVAVDGSGSQSGGTVSTSVAAPAKVPRYVSPSGSDRNPGTRTAPWRTIQRALNRMRPGQTVFVRAGTYAENLKWSKGGSSDSVRAVLRAYPGERPRLTGRVYISADYVALRGFEIVGKTRANPKDVVIWVDESDYVTIAQNDIHDGYESGIFVSEESNHVRIVRNDIHDNGHYDPAVDPRPISHGIYFRGGLNVYIANNKIVDNYCWGVQLYPGPSDGAQVVNNVFVGNGSRQPRSSCGGLIFDDSPRTSVVNNILVRNNVGLGLLESNSGSVYRRNLEWQNGRPNSTSSDVTQAENTTADPRFVDVSRRDYRLRDRSPAIDSADTDIYASPDFSGVARPKGAGPDIGVFER